MWCYLLYFYDNVRHLLRNQKMSYFSRFVLNYSCSWSYVMNINYICYTFYIFASCASQKYDWCTILMNTLLFSGVLNITMRDRKISLSLIQTYLFHAFDDNMTDLNYWHQITMFSVSGISNVKYCPCVIQIFLFKPFKKHALFLFVFMNFILCLLICKSTVTLINILTKI